MNKCMLFALSLCAYSSLFASDLTFCNINENSLDACKRKRNDKNFSDKTETKRARKDNASQPIAQPYVKGFATVWSVISGPTFKIHDPSISDQ